MAHARKTIRNAIAALLNAAPAHPTRTWRTAFETRAPQKRRVHPYLTIHVEQEPAEPLTVDAPVIVSREAMVVIRGYLQISSKETAEDSMDAMSADIETRLTGTALRAAVSGVKTFYLVGTEMELTEEEDKQIAEAILTQTWLVQYATSEGSPETLI